MDTGPLRSYTTYFFDVADAAQRLVDHYRISGSLVGAKVGEENTIEVFLLPEKSNTIARYSDVVKRYLRELAAENPEGTISTTDVIKYFEKRNCERIK